MSTPQETHKANRDAIEARIPHREPFLLLDRIVEESRDELTCEWLVPENADWFRGHYPGEPILPGVLLSEHTFQAGACLISARLQGFQEDRGIPVLAKIENARFKRVIRPGECVRTTVKVRHELGPAWYMNGHAYCDGTIALRIQFVLFTAGAIKRKGV
jgi:3-hydroxyacyl-[acyl-carrier-protein] dehydratase